MWAGSTLAWLDGHSLDPAAWAHLCPEAEPLGTGGGALFGPGCLLETSQPAAVRGADVGEDAGAGKTGPFVLPAVGETLGRWGLGSAPPHSALGHLATAGAGSVVAWVGSSGTGATGKAGHHPSSQPRSVLPAPQPRGSPYLGTGVLPCPVLPAGPAQDPPRPHLGPAQPCYPCPVPRRVLRPLRPLSPPVGQGPLPGLGAGLVPNNTACSPGHPAPRPVQGPPPQLHGHRPW